MLINKISYRNLFKYIGIIENIAEKCGDTVALLTK